MFATARPYSLGLRRGRRLATGMPLKVRNVSLSCVADWRGARGGQGGGVTMTARCSSGATFSEPRDDDGGGDVCDFWSVLRRRSRLPGDRRFPIDRGIDLGELARWTGDSARARKKTLAPGEGSVSMLRKKALAPGEGSVSILRSELNRATPPLKLTSRSRRDVFAYGVQAGSTTNEDGQGRRRI